MFPNDRQSEVGLHGFCDLSDQGVIKTHISCYKSSEFHEIPPAVAFTPGTFVIGFPYSLFCIHNVLIWYFDNPSIAFDDDPILRHDLTVQFKMNNLLIT
jgi:hypothetical protein